MSIQPPRYAIRFLRWFCREDFLDEIEGDLTELFEKQYQQAPQRARFRFPFTVIRYFRPEYLKLFHKSPRQHNIINTAMIFNYFNFAFRSLRKKAGFAILNIFGLAIGIAACLILLRYIDFEASYDRFHVNAASVYRINRISIKNGEPNTPNVWTTWGMGPALQEDIPEVLRCIRTHTIEEVVTYQPAKGESLAFHEKEILAADSTFFSTFSFNAVAGDLNHALDDPNSIVLTRTVARKYFGEEDPLGETMALAGGRVEGMYKVTAVIEDVPENSHFTFRFLIPLHNVLLDRQYRNEDGWNSNNFVTYVQLHDETQYDAAIARIPGFCARHMDPKWKSYNIHYELRLQPLRDIHLTPGLRDYVATVSPKTLNFFAVISIFILVIAWINYINLSTARAMKRAGEVAVRKSIGAFRGELVAQFMVESLVVNFLAVAVAFMLAVTLLPSLGTILDKELTFDFKDIRLWITLGTLFTVGTIAAGIYPAFVMSSFNITESLGSRNKQGGSYLLRRALVIFQFAASLILISGTFLVYSQVKFMQAQNKGLTMDQMLVVEGPGTIKWNDAKQKLKILKEEIRKIAGITGAATSGSVPGLSHNWGADVRRSGTALSEIKLGSVVWVDADFIPLYNIPFLAGRNFNPDISSDKKAVIINRASLNAFGLGSAEEALQQDLIMNSDTVKIIGVLENYNWNSLKSEITPFIFMTDEIVPGNITFHLQSNTIPGTVKAIGQVYNELIPGEPFSYSFLDDSFNTHYKSDQQFGNIFGLFAGLAVVISCLGLSGLASYATAQRLKEIGVRKVLGASVSSIVYLLTSQFLRLVIIASIVSIPLAWYGMNTWLDTFAFKISIRWDMFVIPMLTLMTIAFLTVSGQVIRGAITNPAKILKSE